MSYNIAKIRKLCTASEMKIVEKSVPSEIKMLSPEELQKKIKLTRNLRDKQRDLYRRQTIASRQSPTGARPKSAERNARTKEKKILFEEVLKNFQERLALVKSAKKSKSPATAKKTPAKKAAAKKVPRKNPLKPAKQKPSNLKKMEKGENAFAPENFTNIAALQKAKERQIQSANTTAIRGHISASVRRAQGKRDSR